VEPWSEDAIVFTDGSLTMEGTLDQWTTGREMITAAAGVYVSGAEEKRYRLSEGIALHTAHAAESLALAVGMRGAQGHTIHSDCEAAIAAWSGRRKYRGIRQVNRLAGDGYAEICKVKAHEERTKPEEEWTTEEAGNVKADAVAGNRPDDAGGPVVNVPADVMKDLLAHINPFLWIDSQDRVDFDIKWKGRITRYLRDRDGYRAAANPPRDSRWEGTTPRLASKMWAQYGKAGSWAQAVRIMWDKHLTGENEAKWKMVTTRNCELCGVLPEAPSYALSQAGDG
jgi:hypothetical protein